MSINSIKSWIVKNPKVATWTGIVSLMTTILVFLFVSFLINIANPEKLLSVQLFCIAVTLLTYFLCFFLFYAGFLLTPKTPDEFLTHAQSDQEFKEALSAECHRIEDKAQTDLENAADEVLAPYNSGFKNFFLTTFLSYFSHVLAIVILGAAVTYTMVRLSNGEMIANLNQESSVLTHIYYSSTTTIGICSERFYPLTESAKLIRTIQVLSIFIVVIFGLSHFISFEFNRLVNVRNSILRHLRDSLP